MSQGQGHTVSSVDVTNMKINLVNLSAKETGNLQVDFTSFFENTILPILNLILSLLTARVCSQLRSTIEQSK